MFLSFEGIDGSGKSTQARLLADAMRAEGRDVVLTREPGGSEGAETIRDVVLNGPTGRWSAETEALLFTAARRDHVERLISPALDRGATVISDRFADSTRAYQGATRGDLGDLVESLHRLAVGLDPDLTILVDVEPSDALRRAVGRPEAESRFEAFGLAFQERVRDAFLGLARSHPTRILVIDGSGTEEDVHGRVRAQVP